MGPGAANIEVLGLTSDSRAVRPGYLFAALPGSRADGLDHAADAVARGAVAVLTRPDPRAEALGVPAIVSDVPRHVFAQMAARFLAPQPETAVAVTGTAGKTSVASFARQLWQARGIASASIGTLGVVDATGAQKLPLTTPDPVQLHTALQTLARRGVEAVAVEASSHGLDQCRLDGIVFAAGAFTSFSRDHLDYHSDAESYLAAKMRLFEAVLPAGARAVASAALAPEILERLRGIARRRELTLLTYGAPEADLALLERHAESDGQSVLVRAGGAERRLKLPLYGGFQAENALAALALAVADPAEWPEALPLLEGLEGVAGRLELVARHPSGGAVYVDYAHKPGALEQALSALRPHCAGRLVVIFGCGGDRDRGKRPQMGEIAARLADRAIVSDDNPRSEDPATIRAEVLAGCPGAEEIGDRAAAIRAGLQGLNAGDVLLIAGKGHEEGQEVAGRVRPFNDTVEARRAVRELGGGDHD